MYRLLIVDDEQLVLDGFRDYVDWSSWGFELAGTKSSAVQALETLKKEKIDVILTDIVMQGQNGLKMLKEAQSIDPMVKGVVLSGHEVFDYAVEAMQLGCVDFLTKPVDFERLKEIFLKIKTSLDYEQKSKSFQENYQRLLKYRAFHELIYGGGTVDDESALALSPKFCVLRLYIEDSGSLAKVKNLLEQAQAELQTLFYEVTEHEICGIIGKIHDNALYYLEEACEKLNDQKIKCYIAVSNTSENRADLNRLYLQSGIALNYKYIKGNRQPITYESITKLFSIDYDSLNIQKELLLEYLGADEYEKLANFIQNLLKNYLLDEQSMRFGYPYNALTEIIITMNKYLSANGIKHYLSDQEAFKSILEIYNQTEILSFMDNFIKNCIELIKSHKKDSAGVIIKTAKHYINLHYNENISLNTLSEVVFVTPTYLSKLFYKKTGQHFNQYLTDYRIQRSCEFLKDMSLKIYEIAALVGYDNVKHFGKVFKEKKGITPKEYRDLQEVEA